MNIPATAAQRKAIVEQANQAGDWEARIQGARQAGDYNLADAIQHGRDIAMAQRAGIAHAELIGQEAALAARLATAAPHEKESIGRELVALRARKDAAGKEAADLLRVANIQPLITRRPEGEDHSDCLQHTVYVRVLDGVRLGWVPLESGLRGIQAACAAVADVVPDAELMVVDSRGYRYTLARENGRVVPRLVLSTGDAVEIDQAATDVRPPVTSHARHRLHAQGDPAQWYGAGLKLLDLRTESEREDDELSRIAGVEPTPRSAANALRKLLGVHLARK